MGGNAGKCSKIAVGSKVFPKLEAAKYDAVPWEYSEAGVIVSMTGQNCRVKFGLTPSYNQMLDEPHEEGTTMCETFPAGDLMCYCLRGSDCGNDKKDQMTQLWHSETT